MIASGDLDPARPVRMVVPGRSVSPEADRVRERGPMMRRTLLLTSFVALVVASAAFAKASFPDVIALPERLAARGDRHRRLARPSTSARSRPAPCTAVISAPGRLDARPGRAGTRGDRDRARRGRLFVAGGATGKAFVYDARTRCADPRAPARDRHGSDVRQRRRRHEARGVLHRLASAPCSTGSRSSQNGAPAQSAPGDAADGRLPARRQLQPERHRRHAGRKGARRRPERDREAVHRDPGDRRDERIDLGGATVANGDGLLLHGRTLYVVQNRLNQIAVVSLGKDLASGRVARTITDSDFDVPTTTDRHGNCCTP